MTVRVSKSAFNIREKVSELDKPTGLKGTELMRSETTQEARDLVSVGRKNLVINGDMRFNQRGGTHTTLSDYTLDRWKFQQDALDNYAHNVTQDADSPDAFNNSLKVEVTTSESALDTVEDLAVAQFIEAQNCQALRAGTSSAKPFTLSFWVKSTKTGTFSVSILADPDGNNKIFATTYNINVASTWEYKTIKIPPCSVTTIPDTNGKGLTLRWVLIAGSAYTTASSGVLHERDDYHSSLWAGGHITQMMTDNDVWQLTGVQLEVGENATDFEYRSYGEELALCQRYFIRMDGSSGGLSTGDGAIATLAMWSSGNAYGPIFLPGEMRVAPSLSDWNDLVWYHKGNTYTITSGNIHFAGSCTNRVECRIINVTNGVAGECGWLRVNSSGGHMDFNSEL